LREIYQRLKRNSVRSVRFVSKALREK